MNNREIKFRALNSKNEIIYGLPYTDGVNETLYYKEFNNRLCWRNDEGLHCNQPYKNGTLQQYTGLKDKNGVEIYEGDVIRKCKFKEDENGQSVLSEENKEYYNFVVNFNFGKIWQGYNLDEEYDEVIGNIYQNKNLIN